MKGKTCLTGLLLVSFLLTQGQNKPISYHTDSEINWAGVDRAGDLFLVLANGEVQKIDKEGKKLGTSKFNKTPTLLDPLDGAQSFYYNRADNTYGNISSDMMRVTTKTVDPSFAIRPWLVCPALHELWILDSADFSLKKTEMKSTMVSLEAPLNHLPNKKISDYIHIREYQNYLFVLDRVEGVHMFNGLGKFIKTIGEKNLGYFNFLGEEIYFIVGAEIVFIDLYTNKKRTLPKPADCEFVLLTEDRQYSIAGKSVSIFPFNPE